MRGGRPGRLHRDGQQAAFSGCLYGKTRVVNAGELLDQITLEI